MQRKGSSKNNSRPSQAKSSSGYGQSKGKPGGPPQPGPISSADDEPLPEARRKTRAKPADGFGTASQPDTPKPPKQGSGEGCGGCGFTFEIHTSGDVHIHNYCAPPEAAPPSGGSVGDGDCIVCSTKGSCLPPVAGAKHKLGRDQKLAIRAAKSKVPSVLAASTLHAIRRHVAGYAPANALEQRMSAKLASLPPALLRCIVDGAGQIPPDQRRALFPDPAFSDPAQPLDPDQLGNALIEEIRQRALLDQFGDVAAVERPGKDRMYVPVGEDFFSQVRICRVRQLRTANYHPLLQPQEYTPDELQMDCVPVINNGLPDSICEVRTNDCPGNLVAGVCGKVLEISQGEALELEGVNFFDVNAKVRLLDKETNSISRDVEAFIYGDIDTPREEEVNGATVLINDCRVHDKATFTMPSDLPPGIYQMQLVVPNSINNPGFGPEILSNVEYVHVLPPPSARYQIVIERIIARRETSPEWPGSDEVGLRTLAFALNLSSNPLAQTETRFKDLLDGVEFDSGTARNIERKIFVSDQPILALLIGVLGHEIDSDGAYNDQISEWSDIFVDLIKDQWEFLIDHISQVKDLAKVLKEMGGTGAIIAAVAVVVVVAIDLIYSIWAPADLIIEDYIPLSILDIDRLTSAAAPVPPRSSFESVSGIEVNVNNTIPPEKIPFQYRETREYVSDDEDSRYELTYRYNRLS